MIVLINRNVQCHIYIHVFLESHEIKIYDTHFLEP